MSSTSVQPPIVKLMNEKYIEYKLYGRVVKAGKETTKGIPVIFVNVICANCASWIDSAHT